MNEEVVAEIETYFEAKANHTIKMVSKIWMIKKLSKMLAPKLNNKTKFC